MRRSVDRKQVKRENLRTAIQYRKQWGEIKRCGRN